MIWTLFGYSLALDDDTGQGLIGNPTQYAGLSRLLTEAADQGHTYPTTLFAVFQGLFCVITGALISGAIADRAKFTSWLIYVGAWTVLVYAPVAHWVFDISHDGHVGGWLANRIGVLDFAGGTAVEICSGASGLALVVVLGQRVGFGKDPMRPHNLPYVMLGAGLLWFGWFGFNAGSALAAGHTAVIVFATTLLGRRDGRRRLAHRRAPPRRRADLLRCSVWPRRWVGRDHALVRLALAHRSHAHGRGRRGDLLLGGRPEIPVRV